MLHLRRSWCKYVRGFYPSPCVRALVLMSEMHRLMMFWAEQMADIVVLWAGRAVIGSRPSGCPPTAHLGEENSNQGWWPQDGGRSLRVRTLSFPWGTTSQRGCCSTPATTRHRLKNKRKTTREQKAALKTNVWPRQPSYMKNPVNVGLWDVSQLLSQSCLHHVPLDPVVLCEQVIQQPSMLQEENTKKLNETSKLKAHISCLFLSLS